MEHLPFYVTATFILTTSLALFLFYRIAYSSSRILLALLGWLFANAVLSWKGFYLVNKVPPHLLFALVPPLVAIAVLFFSTKGRNYIDGLDIKKLTLLHIIRLPVELVLFWLFLHKGIPKLMTFEGRNFDVLSGLSAPFIYYGLATKRLGNKMLLVWNLICLGLLLNIVTNALLSAPTPLQRFGFEQPNIAILYFPFIWLPACLVPMVLFSHLVAIRRLLLNK